jgi:hypothetical protein
MLLSNPGTTAPSTATKSNSIHTDLYNVKVFAFPPIPKPSINHLRALDAAAERSAPLQSVRVTAQSVVLNAGQLGTACVEVMSLSAL